MKQYFYTFTFFITLGISQQLVCYTYDDYKKEQLTKLQNELQKTQTYQAHLQQCLANIAMVYQNKNRPIEIQNFITNCYRQIDTNNLKINKIEQKITELTAA